MERKTEWQRKGRWQRPQLLVVGGPASEMAKVVPSAAGQSPSLGPQSRPKPHEPEAPWAVI